MMDDTLSTGIQGEEIACDYLAKKGYTIIDRNWRSGHTEIDIIARDGATLVFCEVKTSLSPRFGSATGWVTQRKTGRVARTALAYIATKRIVNCPFRFDVVAIDVRDGKVAINHMVNAFDAPGGL
jgi:putative endonuclease